MELLRHADCEIVWIPETAKTCLLAQAGSPQTAVYGPYIRLQPGSYRAEFKLSMGAIPQPGVRLGSVEVFSIRHHVCEERVLWAEDFAAGPGSVFDVFFTAPDPPPEDYEFRVHTSGCVPIYVREIVVSRWPHPSLQEALIPEGASTIQSGTGRMRDL